MKYPLIIFFCLTFCNAIAQSIPMENKFPTIEIIRYTIPKEQRITFETAYTKAGEFLKASPYCQGFEMIRGTDEPQHYIIRIHWTSVDDHLQKFRNSDAFKSFFNLVKPFYNNIDEMKHYESLISSF